MTGHEIRASGEKEKASVPNENETVEPEEENVEDDGYGYHNCDTSLGVQYSSNNAKCHYLLLRVAKDPILYLLNGANIAQKEASKEAANVTAYQRIISGVTPEIACFSALSHFRAAFLAALQTILGTISEQNTRMELTRDAIATVDATESFHGTFCKDIAPFVTINGGEQSSCGGKNDGVRDIDVIIFVERTCYHVVAEHHITRENDSYSSVVVCSYVECKGVEYLESLEGNLALWNSAPTSALNLRQKLHNDHEWSTLVHSSLADFRDIEIAPASSSTHNDLTLSQISIQKATEFEQGNDYDIPDGVDVSNRCNRELHKLLRVDWTKPDPSCTLTTPVHVYEDDGDCMSALLEMESPCNNKEKNKCAYYIVQLLESEDEKQYWCWSRWGVVGLGGMKSLSGPHPTFQTAFAKFSDKFLSKSGHSWSQRRRFSCPKYRFTFVMYDRSYHEQPAQSAADEGSPSSPARSQPVSSHQAQQSSHKSGRAGGKGGGNNLNRPSNMQPVQTFSLEEENRILSKHSLTLQEYSEKAYVVRGSGTFDCKAMLSRSGGKYNPYLKGGPGWIVAKSLKGGLLYKLNQSRAMGGP